MKKLLFACLFLMGCSVPTCTPTYYLYPDFTSEPVSKYYVRMQRQSCTTDDAAGPLPLDKATELMNKLNKEMEGNWPK